jgi:hypothetical protein
MKTKRQAIVAIWNLTKKQMIFIFYKRFELNCPHCNKVIKDSLVISESQKLLASKTSEAKKISSANNGKLGGRPKKPKTAKNNMPSHFA